MLCRDQAASGTNVNRNYQGFLQHIQSAPRRLFAVERPSLDTVTQEDFQPKGKPGYQNGFYFEGGRCLMPLRDFVKVFGRVTIERNPVSINGGDRIENHTAISIGESRPEPPAAAQKLSVPKLQTNPSKPQIEHAVTSR